jgi:proteasome lid subunit RPN8/RPN11
LLLLLRVCAAFWVGLADLTKVHEISAKLPTRRTEWVLFRCAMLVFKKAEYDALRRHGEQTYPHECCGVLLGRFKESDRLVEQVAPCGNTRDDRPQDRYHIDPKELIGLQRRATQQGLEIVGFYHSHPDHPAQWSKTDLAEAHWIGCSYVITAVEKGAANRTNSFVLLGESEEEKHFETEEIKVTAVVEDPSLCR